MRCNEIYNYTFIYNKYENVPILNNKKFRNCRNIDKIKNNFNEL